MHGHFKKMLEGLDMSMENKGDKLVITVTGDKNKLQVVEKKLKALHELCSGEGGCCCDCD